MMIDLPIRGYRGKEISLYFARYRPLWLKYGGQGILRDFQVKCIFDK